MIREDLLQNEFYYHARAIVNNLPQPLDREGIVPECNKHVHAILLGDSQLVMALARHIALIAHYPNFNENTGANRTLITLVSPKISVNQMEQSRFFGQLLNYITVIDQKGKKINNSTSCEYIDIAFQLIPQDSYDYTPQADEIVTRINTNDECWQPLMATVEQTVDVIPAQKVHMAYCVGEDLNKIDENDIASVHAYSRAIRHYGLTLWQKRKRQNQWDKCSLTNKLSSFLLSECLESYKRSVCVNGRWYKKKLYRALPELARTEHLRWCVAQLIAGFRPYSTQEMVHYSTLSIQEKAIDKKEKKAQKIHLDICSNKELSKNDFDAIKYDSLLLLVMPKIVK